MSNEPKSLSVALAFLTVLKLLINTAQRLVYPFLPAIARGLGIPLTQAGLLQSARWLAGLTTPLVVRAVSERRRRLIVAALLLFLLGTGVTAATNVFIGAMVGFVLMGIAKPTYDIAAQAYVADRTPYQERARYMAVLELTWGGSLLLGAPLSGWLIHEWGWTTPFWVFAALTVVALAVVGWIIEPTGEGVSTEVARSPFGTGAWGLLLAAGVYSLCAELMIVVLGAWLEDGFGLSLLSLGLVASIVAVAELIGEGSTLALADRLGKRRSLMMGLLITAAAWGVLTFTHGSLVGGIVTMAVALVGFEFTIVATYALASEVVPGGRARYLAWLMVTLGVGRAIGAAVGPVLFEQFGITGNAVVAFVTTLGSVVIVRRWVAEVRSAPAETG